MQAIQLDANYLAWCELFGMVRAIQLDANQLTINPAKVQDFYRI